MKKRIMRLGVLLIFACACPPVFAQLLQIRAYGTSDGLPQSEVISIFQDHVGYLWFGTYENGLARYDGRNFTRFSLPDRRLHGAVNAIFQDRRGVIWIGTEQGLIRLLPNAERGDTTVTVFTTAHGLPGDYVTCIHEDAQGTLWIGTLNGACRLVDSLFVAKLTQRRPENNVIAVITSMPDGSVWMGTRDGVNIWRDDSVRTLTTAEGLANNWVRAVFCDRDGVMWIGTRAGLTRVHNGVLRTFSQPDGLEDIDIYALVQDQQGSIWIGARTGLSKFDPALANSPSARRLTKPHSSDNKIFRHFDRRHGLSSDRIATLYVDYENNLWIGTWGGGACKLQLLSSYIENYSMRNGLPVASVYSFLEDRQGRIWIGTNGGGVAILDGDSIIIRDTRSGLPNNVVHALAAEPSGAIWIGTHGGAVRIPVESLAPRLATTGQWQKFTRKNGLPGERISNIFCTATGEVWLATFDAGAIRYREGKFTTLNMETGLPSNFVHCIHQDRYERLWIATNNGLFLRDGNRQRVFHRADGLPSESIYCIFEDHAGHLWFGTRRGGVTRGEDEKFYTLNTSDGFADEVIYFIIADHLHRLWFGTNDGVQAFLPAPGKKLEDSSDVSPIKEQLQAEANDNSLKNSQSFLHLTAVRGLVDNECNTRAALCDRHGNLWFGTAGGATKLYSDRLPPVTPPPRVHIQSVEVDDHHYYLHREDLQLRAKAKSTIIFHFSTLSFLDEQHVSSQVYLERFDQSWINLGNANRMRYTNLPPGSYTFHLRGMNAFGVTSAKAAELRLKILPPFYRTLWFMIGSALLIIGFIYGGYRLRLRHVRKRNLELEKLVEEKTHNLQEAHAFLSSIKDFLPVGLLVVDHKRFVVEANRTCVELFGYTQEELHGQELHNLLSSPKLSRDALWATVREASGAKDLLAEGKVSPTTGQAEIEMIGLRRDGEKFPCRVHSCSVRNERGELRYVILTCEDIGEWKQLEQRLIENEKQLALVDLLAGMGDILNNKLAGIQGYLDLLKNALTGRVPTRPDRGQGASLNPVEVVNWAQNSTTEMSTVLRQLLEFGAYLKKVPVLPVDLRVILRSLERQWSKVLKVRVPEMPAPIPVKVIPKIKSGLDEVFRNSHEANAQEIVIHVETLTNLSRVRLTLTDDGRGISPENVGKVFLPFFRTKATPHPGLGLWKLRQLVQQSGGTVEIVSIPKGGTQLVIILPMATIDQLADDAAAQAAAIAEYAI